MNTPEWSAKRIWNWLADALEANHLLRKYTLVLSNYCPCTECQYNDKEISK